MKKRPTPARNKITCKKGLRPISITEAGRGFLFYGKYPFFVIWDIPLPHTVIEVVAMIDRLRGLREDHDLTQAQIAKELQVHQSTYSDYERGNINIPLETLKKLAVFFNTSVDYILDLTDEIRPYPRKKK